MPDHVHLLLQPFSDNDLVAFLQRYKSWITRRSWDFEYTGKLWQRIFYDHILRSDEELDRHILYIIDNPVRAGLVDEWQKYPFTGSFVFDLNEMDR